MSNPVIWCDLLQPGLTTRLYQVAQGLNQLSSECLQGWRFQRVSNKALEQDFSHPCGEEGFFLRPVGIFHVATFILCYLSTCCAPPRRLWLCLLPSITVGSRRLQLDLPLIFSKLNKLSTLNLSSYIIYSSYAIILMTTCWILL